MGGTLTLWFLRRYKFIQPTSPNSCGVRKLNESVSFDLQPPRPAADVTPPSHHSAAAGGPPAVEAAAALPDLLGDIPFTLAPHVLALQAGFSMVPDVLLSRDVNYNLAGFQYDFTLENSVLHSS